MLDASLFGAAPDAGSLTYPTLEPPAFGTTTPIVPGVHWIRMPLPMELDHINLWLLEHEEGAILIDTGLAAETCRAAWEQLERGPLRDRPLQLIVVTHLHPDHAGLAAWLQERHGAPVWTSVHTERQMRALIEPASDERLRARREFLRAHGLEIPEGLAASLSGAGYRAIVSGLPRVEQHPREPHEVHWGGQRWRWLETDGHALGHLCLHAPESRLIICGDQILPTISPNVSLVLPEEDPNPLGAYLDSLERLTTLDPATLVLPSHGRPFVGIGARARELRLHHERQLARALEACSEPRTAHETLRFLFRRRLTGFHLLLALGEAIAHLEYLYRRGSLDRMSGSDGVIRYVRR
jgi:glyoxylase-like metal-dependent hydrolase (beta-lactamase superfamily II)